MRVAIHSLQSTLFSGSAEKLIVRTPLGEITVLDHHVPLISSILGPQIEIVDSTGKKVHIKITSGVLEVRPNSEVVLLASLVR